MPSDQPICVRKRVRITWGKAVLIRGVAIVDTQEIVYTDTWYLPVHKPLGTQRQTAPAVPPHASPFRCGFGGLALPIVDCHVSERDRTPVHVLVSDDPDFFPLLAESDRGFLLQIFAFTLLEMVKSRRSRFQYGFVVEIQGAESVVTTGYVEYHVALIKTDFGGEPAKSRYVANIWSGPPPKKIRRKVERPDS